MKNRYIHNKSMSDANYGHVTLINPYFLIGDAIIINVICYGQIIFLKLNNFILDILF